jgi:hypothetical protein
MRALPVVLGARVSRPPVSEETAGETPALLGPYAVLIVGEDY